jgi:carbamoyltransferase
MKNNFSKILSLNINYNSGAALFINGNLMSAVEEERLSRIKLTHEFPEMSISMVLRENDLHPSQINLVLLSSYITPNFISMVMHKYYLKKRNDVFSPLLNLVMAEQLFMRKTGLIKLEANLVRRIVKNKLSKLGITAPIKMVDHHLCHSYSAYASAPFDDCLVVTMDAMGDGISSQISFGKEGRVTPIYQVSGFNAPAFIYSQITVLLGFKSERHEGKITGLAAHGNPHSCDKNFRQLMDFQNGSFKVFKPLRKDHTIYKEILKYSREDIAASLQYVFEDIITKYVRHYAIKTKKTRIALSGGVFANVKVNQKIAELESVSAVFVYPNMGDGGNMIGAFYAYQKSVQRPINDVYYGPSFSNVDIKKVLDSLNLIYRYYPDIEKKTAELLSEGKVLANFKGRMEFGPRALGNRSILYRPDDPSVNTWLNKKLSRTEFMPFAPATLYEDAEKYYNVIEGTKTSAQFMTITYECTPLSQRQQPAVVHLDNTARPQLVREDVNPSFHRIINQFKELTGIGSIINTSFNMHEEPIVCSPKEAILAFHQTKLDALILENYLILQVE